jgi:hypothetical protein
LSAAGVGSAVTAHCGDAPASPPWPQPKSLAAGPHAILKQALSHSSFERRLGDLRWQCNREAEPLPHRPVSTVSTAMDYRDIRSTRFHSRPRNWRTPFHRTATRPSDSAPQATSCHPARHGSTPHDNWKATSGRIGSERVAIEPSPTVATSAPTSHKPKSLQQTVFYPTVWGVYASAGR